MTSLTDIISTLEKRERGEGINIAESLKKARELKIGGDRESALMHYEHVIDAYEEVLGKDILADILIEMGHINLTLKQYYNAENCVDVVMVKKGLDNRYYAEAQILKAHIEANKGYYEEAKSIIENAQQIYPTDDLLYTLNMIAIQKKEVRAKAN